jgi:hypothetical protein
VDQQCQKRMETNQRATMMAFSLRSLYTGVGFVMLFYCAILYTHSPTFVFRRRVFVRALSYFHYGVIKSARKLPTKDIYSIIADEVIRTVYMIQNICYTGVQEFLAFSAIILAPPVLKCENAICTTRMNVKKGRSYHSSLSIIYLSTHTSPFR